MRTDTEWFRAFGIAVDEPREDEHRGRALFWILALPVLFAIDWIVIKLVVKGVVSWLT